MGSDLTNKCWITNRKEIKSYNGALMPYKGDLDALHRLQTASWLSKHQSWPRTKSFQRFKTSSVINKTKERKAFKIVREQKRAVSCLTAPRVCGVWSPENLLPPRSTHSCRTFISIRTGKKKKIYIYVASFCWRRYQSRYKRTWLASTVKHYSDWCGTRVWLSHQRVTATASYILSCGRHAGTC